MLLHVDYSIAAADHFGVFEGTIDATLKQAIRLWRASLTPKQFPGTHDSDSEAHALLRSLLESYKPGYCYAVTAIHKIRLADARGVGDKHGD